MSDIKSMLAKINQDFASLKETYSTGNCWRLSTTLQESEAQLREEIQKITYGQITQVINKLRHNQPLDPEELAYIKLWIVGDADYYVKVENNYNDWVQELERLMTEVNNAPTGELDFITASRLRAMFLDGMRVIGDIMFFLKQKERVKNFTESTEEISLEERDYLIQLLEGKIQSPNA